MRRHHGGASAHPRERERSGQACLTSPSPPGVRGRVPSSWAAQNVSSTQRDVAGRRPLDGRDERGSRAASGPTRGSAPPAILPSYAHDDVALPQQALGHARDRRVPPPDPVADRPWKARPATVTAVPQDARRPRAAHQHEQQARRPEPRGRGQGRPPLRRSPAPAARAAAGRASVPNRSSDDAVIPDAAAAAGTPPRTRIAYCSAPEAATPPGTTRPTTAFRLNASVTTGPHRSARTARCWTPTPRKLPT